MIRELGEWLCIGQKLLKLLVSKMEFNIIKWFIDYGYDLELDKISIIANIAKLVVYNSDLEVELSLNFEFQSVHYTGEYIGKEDYSLCRIEFDNLSGLNINEVGYYTPKSLKISDVLIDSKLGYNMFYGYKKSQDDILIRVFGISCDIFFKTRLTNITTMQG